MISLIAKKIKDTHNLSEINQLIKQLENGPITKDLLDKIEVILDPIDEQLFKNVLALYNSEEINELYPIESNEQEAELPIEDSSQEFSIIKMVENNPSMPDIYSIYKAEQKDNTNTLNNFKIMLKENKDEILNALLNFNQKEGDESPFIKMKNEQTRLRFINYDLKSLEEGLQPTEEVKENTIEEGLQPTEEGKENRIFDMLTEDQKGQLKPKDIEGFIRNILYNINSLEELKNIKETILKICPNYKEKINDVIKKHFNPFDTEVSELKGFAREVIEYIEPNNNAPAPEYPPSSSFKDTALSYEDGSSNNDPTASESRTYETGSHDSGPGTSPKTP